MQPPGLLRKPNFGTAQAVAYVLLVVVLMLVFKVDIRNFVGPVTLLPAAGFVLVGLMAGFVTDCFQPAGAPALHAQQSASLGSGLPAGPGPRRVHENLRQCRRYRVRRVYLGTGPQASHRSNRWP